MLKHRKILWIAASFALLPQPLLASPFCVQTQALPPDCVYTDAAQCRKRAQALNGYCVANPAELVISAGGTGKFCLVLSSREAQCMYADRNLCENDAVAANGVCIEKSATDVNKDPYQLDIHRNY